MLELSYGAQKRCVRHVRRNEGVQALVVDEGWRRAFGAGHAWASSTSGLTSDGCV